MLPPETENQAEQSASAGQVSSHLGRHKAARFVGRSVELRTFRSALAAPPPPFLLLYVWGGAGIGKTSLLAEMARVCEELSIPYASYDAGLLGTSTEELEGAFAALRSFEGTQVALFDGFEQLEPFEPWLRNELLPSLPRATLVVFASRRRPSLGWALNGWSSFMRVLELGELTESEARDLLADHGVPASERQNVVRFAAGIPLLLAFAGDVAEEVTDRGLGEPERQQVSVLASLLFDGISSDRRRLEALGLCAIARFTTLDLLEKTLPGAVTRESFSWLARLSFVRHSPFGLQPHALVRRAMVDELRRRRPSTYLNLQRRLRAYYAQKAENDADRERWVFDRMWLDRDVSGITRYLEWNEADAPFSFVRARPGIHPRILELIERHEGEDSSRLAARWLELSAPFDVCHGQDDPVSAMLMAIAFPRDEALAKMIDDPVLPIVTRHLRARAKLSDGESALLFRYCLSARAHQEPCPETSIAFAHAAKRLAAERRLAYAYCVVSSPERWIAGARLCGLEAERLARIQFGQRALFVLALDWRGKSFADVFSRWTQTNATELVGRAWQLTAAHPLSTASDGGRTGHGPRSRLDQQLPTEAGAADERHRLATLLERRVEKLARAARLSPRERQVLGFVLLGRHANDVAKVIAISPRTARLHLSHLFTKLGAQSRLDIFRVLL